MLPWQPLRTHSHGLEQLQLQLKMGPQKGAGTTCWRQQHRLRGRSHSPCRIQQQRRHSRCVRGGAWPVGGGSAVGGAAAGDGAGGAGPATGSSCCALPLSSTATAEAGVNGEGAFAAAGNGATRAPAAPAAPAADEPSCCCWLAARAAALLAAVGACAWGAAGGRTAVGGGSGAGSGGRSVGYSQLGPL